MESPDDNPRILARLGIYRWLLNCVRNPVILLCSILIGPPGWLFLAFGWALPGRRIDGLLDAATSSLDAGEDERALRYVDAALGVDFRNPTASFLKGKILGAREQRASTFDRVEER